MNLIVGENSLIARALQKDWKEKKIEFQCTTRNSNLSNEKVHFYEAKDNKITLPKKFENIIICISCTDLNECEKYPRKTRIINVQAIKNLIDHFHQSANQIIIFSSSQVFDGSKKNRKVKDKVSPINEYGKQKVEIEKYALNFSNTSILRLTRVFSFDYMFFKNWKDNLQNNKEIRAFYDYNISPLPIDLLLKKINLTIQKRVFGIQHCHGGIPDISYFDFALSIADELKCSRSLVKKYSLSEHNFKYKLQKYSSLLEE